MLFNSLQFLLFYVIITISYWYLPHKYRWLLLLLSSCYFYMAFVPMYILIIGFTIVIDYIAGIYLEKTTNKKWRKLLLIISLCANIGVLALFKYFNFLNGIVENLLGLKGQHALLPFLTILLPIGLSFHTFQAMSYTIEVYRGNHKAERHFGIYALYVMFYPQLVAGPIERPQNILWQFHKKQTYSFDDLKAGLMQMAFGLFKKVVIADRVSVIVDSVYADHKDQSGSTLLITAILYSFQIYCDFSGYSDIGIGAARTMGFKLVTNFNVPYLSRSMSEFWSKWHMSLSTWFKDYLYIPLGGSRVKLPRKYFNLMVVFLISGLWHGASWTFVVWGMIHGVLLVLENIKTQVLGAPSLKNNFVTILHIGLTFMLVTLAWVFFRSPDFDTAMDILIKIFGGSILTPVNFGIINKAVLIFCFILIGILMIKERYLLVIPTKNNVSFYLSISFIVIVCYVFGVFNNQQFIYFQF